jgi:hypothetical protein
MRGQMMKMKIDIDKRMSFHSRKTQKRPVYRRPRVLAGFARTGATGTDKNVSTYAH